MNYELVIDDLNVWHDDELLFRDYFQLNQENASLDTFLKKYESDPINLQYALHPETVRSDLTEMQFISAGRNVAIVRHPRYFPLFYHKHGFFEAIYVLSGTCTQHFQGKKLTLQKGDLCLMAPDVLHGIEVMDDSIILNILVRYSTFMDIFMHTVRDKTQISEFFLNNIYSKKRRDYLLFHTEGDEVIRNYVLDMYLEQIHLDTFSDQIMCSILTIFFTQLIRRYKDSMEISGMHQKKQTYENAIIPYIIDHYNDISIEQVAGHFHFSRQYCSRLIKDISGYTFSELLTNIRMQQGENLLSFTPLSIESISEIVGYKNPETFIRAFKKSAGCTPTDFRSRINAANHLPYSVSLLRSSDRFQTFPTVPSQ